MSARYAFVPPRFGAGVAGGAETLVASLAYKLAERGDKIEIWSTCAKDNRSWANQLPSGVSIEQGLTVRRFAVDKRDTAKWITHQVAISEGLNIDLDSQIEWMQNGVNSSELLEHIYYHAPNFDAVFFAPYLFGTTFFGAQVVPEKSILIPCLHDETYAYLDLMQVMFRKVRGALFNSGPERDLAQRIYGEVLGDQVGMGFEPTQAAPTKPYFKENFPYLLYLGRKETGKGAQHLIDHFIRCKEQTGSFADLKLVVCGGGDFSDLNRPEALLRSDIVDLKHVCEEEKVNLLKNALLLVQPSLNESFSIVLMEAWLAKTPVLVNAQCEVTRQHVLESGGGLYYGSFDDFDQVVRELYSNQKLREALAVAGMQYVQSRYDWNAVISRFDAVVKSILH